MSRLGICVVVLFLMTGCTSSSTSNTARTSVEQLLISNAVDQSLNKVDFRPFAGQNVFLDDSYLECVDKKYLVSSIRHRLLRSGARLAAKAEEADVVIEPRAGAVGTSTADAYLGMPEIVLPGMLTLPEVRLLERKKQRAVAKIGLVAYDPKTKTVLGDGGMSLAESDDSNWYVFGLGPYQNGSVRKEVAKGVKTRPRDRSQAIPQQVAFSSPAEQAKPDGKLQLASGKKEKLNVVPAKKSTYSSPIWAR